MCTSNPSGPGRLRPCQVLGNAYWKFAAEARMMRENASKPKENPKNSKHDSCMHGHACMPSSSSHIITVYHIPDQISHQINIPQQLINANGDTTSRRNNGTIGKGSKGSQDKSPIAKPGKFIEDRMPRNGRTANENPPGQKPKGIASQKPPNSMSIQLTGFCRGVPSHHAVIFRRRRCRWG